MRQKVTGRARRKLRIRKKVQGTAQRPRLSVFRSAKHIYAQAFESTRVQSHRSTEARSTPQSRSAVAWPRLASIKGLNRSCSIAVDTDITGVFVRWRSLRAKRV